MEDDGVLGELVQVRYRLDEDGGCGGDAGEFAIADGLEDGEERVGVLADCEDLGGVSVAILHTQLGMPAYLWLGLAHDAGRMVLLQSLQRLRELGFGRKGRHDRHNHVGGQVGNSGHCIEMSVYHNL